MKKCCLHGNGVAAAVAAVGLAIVDPVDPVVEAVLAIAEVAARCLRSCPCFVLFLTPEGRYPSFGVASQKDQKLKGIGRKSRRWK